MNKVIMMGRLTNDPEVKGEDKAKRATYRLAVDRKYKREGEPTADFISCIAFGKNADFTEKYFYKGLKVSIIGSIRISYFEKDGKKLYSTTLIVEENYFAEGKNVTTSTTDNEKVEKLDTVKENSEDVDDDLPF